MKSVAKVPTRRHRAVVQRVLEGHGKVSVRQAMLSEGYSEASAGNPKQFQGMRRAFSDILDSVDDDIIMRRIVKALMSEDNRAALQAGDMLLKLKDRYPAGKLKIQAYNEEIERLKETPTLPESTGL